MSIYKYNAQVICFFVFVGVNLLYLSPTYSQEQIRVVAYNVENLFDTKDNPQTNDDDFLPEGKNKWTHYRYWQKLKNITRVITAIGEMKSPALVGLIEIENDSVLHDLTRRSPLRMQRYSYICTDSPDRRGVNVGLLYQPEDFKLIKYHEYQVEPPRFHNHPTRHILHGIGQLVNGDTLDVFVCHYPSRREGKRKSEPYRVNASRIIREKVDSLFRERTKARVIIMGDFNDEPQDKSLSQVLGARPLEEQRVPKDTLVNLFWRKHKAVPQGTYRFQGKWNMLDQFIVSGSLLDASSTVRVLPLSVKIFAPTFLHEEDVTYGGIKPFRTYLGPRYIGGFSDHFPIVMDLIIEVP